MITSDKATWFATQVVDYAKAYGRFDLPWKNPATPYRVWISEVMLQQTQVQTVMGYFERFMTQFPHVKDLGQADLDEVLRLWAGLGYYRRAHHLHKAAQMILDNHKGEFPNTLESLLALPGIGRSTAGAILAQGFHVRAPILDGNVKRVLCRFFTIPGYPDASAVLKTLWHLSDQVTPEDNIGEYTQGIMDIGAVVCTKKNPQCGACPLKTHCQAFQTQTQSLYPAPKPKKAKPIRRCAFAVVLNDAQELLLVKRPNKGIWSSMWSLPSLPPKKHLKSFCEKAWPFAELMEERPEARHTFTHFHLDYKPVIMRAYKEPIFINREHLWVKPQALEQFGVPAPIKKILKELYLGKVDLLPQA